MRAKPAVIFTRACGIAFAIAAGLLSIYATQLVHMRPPPPVQTTQLMVCGMVLLLAVSVRLFVFGISAGKRLGMALLLSLLLCAMIGVLPAIESAWKHGVSSDFQMGLFFMVVEFVVPSVVLSLALSAIPMFDRRAADGAKPTI